MYEKIYLKILLWDYSYENDKVKRNGYVKRGIGWQADPFFTAACIQQHFTAIIQLRRCRCCRQICRR